ncbi:uncharacterized protein [Oscarella lobularis]|uniref:uncharacterized protein n=1 Tax=Oscarella lobularis TaxID=121494 RepID=UPI00331434C3
MTTSTWRPILASVAFLAAATLSGMACFINRWVVTANVEQRLGLFEFCSRSASKECRQTYEDPFSGSCANITRDDWETRVLRLQVAGTLMIMGCTLCLIGALVSSPLLERYSYAMGLTGFISGCAFLTAVVLFVTIDKSSYCFSSGASFHYPFGFAIASVPVAWIAGLLAFQTTKRLLQLWDRQVK